MSTGIAWALPLDLGGWRPCYKPGATTRVAVCPSLKGVVSGSQNQNYYVDADIYASYSYYPESPKPAEWTGTNPNSHVMTYAFTAWLGSGNQYEVSKVSDYAARKISGSPTERFIATDGLGNALVWEDA